MQVLTCITLKVMMRYIPEIYSCDESHQIGISPLSLGASMLDDFPDDLRPVVHKHWGKFPPQHPLVKDAFGLLFGMLFVVAFLGNSWVIYVFAGTKRLRTPVIIAKQICF